MSCLQVFAKAPVSGRVKTRMQAVLSPVQCAQLHRSLLLQTLQTASRLSQNILQLWCHPDIQHPFFSEMQERFHLELHPQQGHDLGERMRNALKQGLRSNKTALLIGSDCPSFTEDYLNNAFKQLESALDLVLGPAEDGGFVLLGTNKPPPESLFEGVLWGENTVLQRTIRNVEGQGMRYGILPPLRDIDRPEDLKLID